LKSYKVEFIARGFDVDLRHKMTPYGKENTSIYLLYNQKSAYD